jgi:exodeoxyribonuclease VII small subunit
MAKKNASFEEQLSELKNITKQLEDGQLSLDDSLKLFEKGIGLYRTCSSLLESTERKVTILMENNEVKSLTDLEVENGF